MFQLMCKLSPFIDYLGEIVYGLTRLDHPKYRC